MHRINAACEKINDFDLYFTDHATTKAVAEYYVKRFEVKNRSGIPCAISVDDADGRVRIVVKSSGIASEEGAISEYEYFESSPQDRAAGYVGEVMRSEEHTSEIQSLMRSSYAVFCLKTKNNID